MSDKQITLPVGWSYTERGNTLIESVHDSGWNAWISLGEDLWLEISLRPGNYPCLNVAIVEASEHGLANHINNNFPANDWHLRKCNLPGVELRDE